MMMRNASRRSLQRQKGAHVLEIRGDCEDFLQLVKQWTSDFTAKATGDNLMRVQVATSIDYTEVMEEASARKMDCYSHAVVPDKLLKLVFEDFPQFFKKELKSRTSRSAMCRA